ncbi:MAG: rhamnulose-1-phosphate aldolase [Barnesiella sp.]
MKSILENRPALAKQVDEIAEVAGYLWQKGWAERNGGNITVNITGMIDDEIRQMPAISEKTPIGKTLPNLKGCYFYCKGTNKRMDFKDGLGKRFASAFGTTARYEILQISCQAQSELPAHLSMHDYLISNGSGYKAAIHTHPIDLVAMTHNPAFLKKDVLSHLLWSMIPETKAFCPKGLGIVPYKLPSSIELADATLEQLKEYDVVMWEKHGVCSVSENVMEAFDMIDTLSKSAQIYLTAKSMGFEPDGMTDEQMKEMTVANYEMILTPQ